MIAGVKITAKSTGRKNNIIGTVNLGGNPAAFFFGEHHTIVAAFLGNDPQGGAKRGAVTLGLYENGRDLPHLV